MRSCNESVHRYIAMRQVVAEQLRILELTRKGGSSIDYVYIECLGDGSVAAYR